MDATPDELRRPRIVTDGLGRRRVYPSTEQRLTARLSPLTPGGCREWEGFCNPKGYGQIAGPHGLELTHRVAFVLAHGPIPRGLNVHHRCDNPPCCASDHLWAGTPLQNTADMLAKGRCRAPRGLASGMAKLSDADVAVIRAESAAGLSGAEIAERWGLHASYVSRLVRRERRGA